MVWGDVLRTPHTFPFADLIGCFQVGCAAPGCNLDNLHFHLIKLSNLCHKVKPPASNVQVLAHANNRHFISACIQQPLLIIYYPKPWGDRTPGLIP